MPKVLVIYHSRTGRTEAMAKAIGDAIGAEGVEVTCKKMEDTGPDELLQMDVW